MWIKSENPEVPSLKSDNDESALTFGNTARIGIFPEDLGFTVSVRLRGSVSSNGMFIAWLTESGARKADNT